MSKEQSPAFQFYPSDYLSDINVQLMTVVEEGCYIRLLAYCWTEGDLPDDPETLKALCKGVSLSDRVRSCFESHGDRLRHKRLDAERLKQAEFREAKSQAGIQGNIKRWGTKRKPGIAKRSLCDVLRVAKASQTIALQSSSLSSSSINTPIVPKSDNGTSLQDRFMTFWAAYPRRESKVGAWKAFQKINPDDKTMTLILEWLPKAIASDQWQDRSLIPYPQKFLNERRWEDDPPPHKETSAEQMARISREIEEEQNAQQGS